MGGPNAKDSEMALEAAGRWSPVGQNHDPTHLLELREAYATGFYLGLKTERGKVREKNTDERILAYLRNASGEVSIEELRSVMSDLRPIEVTQSALRLIDAGEAEMTDERNIISA